MTVQELYDFACKYNLLDHVITINAEPFGFRAVSIEQIEISSDNREIHF